MRQLINNIRITGELVAKDISEFKIKNKDDAIGGSIVLRTADKSEHEVHLFSYKYKRDSNKQFTSETSYFYEKYCELNRETKDMAHCLEGEFPSILTVTDGMFLDNDFRGSDGTVVSNNRISARFVDIVPSKDYDTTVMQAKFEVEGIIESISDEIVKKTPTGNLIVMFNAIKQTSDGFGTDANYKADRFVPIKLTVDKSMVESFKSAGYYPGCFTKFAGLLINTAETREIVEHVTFGEDIRKEVKSSVHKYEIKSGTSPDSIFDHGLTSEIVDMLKIKRKAKIDEILNNSSIVAASQTATVPNLTFNPFAR